MGVQSRLKLHLLSRWCVEVDGKAVALKSLKSRALLTYLLLETGRDLQRSDLADLIWPGIDTKKARASLRQSLTDIRKACGPLPFHINGSQIFLDPQHVVTDVALLESDLNRGLVNSSTLDGLAKSPDALQGFDGLGDPYDRWLSHSRERLLKDIVQSAEATLDSPSLDTRAQQQLAQALLDIDSLNEKAARALIATLAAQNDNAAALRVYNDFFKRIEDELGVEPAQETQTLAVRIKLGETPYDHPAVSVVEASTPRPLTMVAVLPFDRLGPHAVPDFVVLGMLDHITCKLAAFPAPAVISSNSTRQYLGQSPVVTDVARALGASYVLTGTVMSDGESALVTVQLCDGGDGRVHWASTRKVALHDTFAASLELADEIVQALEPSINVAELNRARDLPRDALEPHHLVLSAKDALFQLSRTGFQRAGELLDSALEIGPNFAPAHVLAAEWHGINLWQGWAADPDQTRASLENHSRKAVYLAPENGRALAQWGHHKITLGRDFDGAMALFDKALSLWPNDSETLFWTVPTLAHAGRARDAVQHGEKALQLSPLDPLIHRNEHFLSLAYYARGEYDEAARLGLSSFSRAPTYGSNLRVTMAALVSAGRLDEARELAQAHHKAEPAFKLSEFRHRMGFKDPTSQARYADLLATAGVQH